MHEVVHGPNVDLGVVGADLDGQNRPTRIRQGTREVDEQLIGTSELVVPHHIVIGACKHKILVVAKLDCSYGGPGLREGLGELVLVVGVGFVEEEGAISGANCQVFVGKGVVEGGNVCWESESCGVGEDVGAETECNEEGD